MMINRITVINSNRAAFGLMRFLAPCSYSSEPLETRGLSPGQLSGLLPDFAMDAVTQRVTSRAQGSFSTGVPQPAPVKVAENSAKLT
jgi:hypothetical protein